MNLLCIFMWFVLRDLVIVGRANGALDVQVTDAQCKTVAFKCSS